jgi:hypothetical protein
VPFSVDQPNAIGFVLDVVVKSWYDVP